MSDSPLKLAVTTPQANVQQKIVELLTEVLERAKAGDFESVMVWAVPSNDTGVETWSSADTDLWRTIGQLEILKAKQIRRYLGVDE